MIAVTVREAEFPRDAEILRQLFREYARGLGIDLDFQGLEAELAELPGKYAPPDGVALIAENGAGSVIGCVAMRPLAPGICEMKRLYLRPEARGTGAGQLLADSVTEAARRAGHNRMLLDTLDHMHAALRLYEKLGFRRIPAYYDNPLPGAVYMGKDLHLRRGKAGGSEF